jgi:hypothetical protein
LGKSFIFPDKHSLKDLQPSVSWHGTDDFSSDVPEESGLVAEGILAFRTVLGLRFSQGWNNQACDMLELHA